MVLEAEKMLTLSNNTYKLNILTFRILNLKCSQSLYYRHEREMGPGVTGNSHDVGAVKLL